MYRAGLLMIVCAGVTFGQGEFPRLGATVDRQWPKLPAGWTFQETPGVAADSRGHVYVFHRGPQPIIEFDRGGDYVRSWGGDVFVRPHGLRFDREGNLWAVDDLGHVVVKMDAQGRVRMVLGRKGVKGETNENFDRPTDVAFAPNGDIYVSDGYGNSRVVQFTKDGKFVRAWGTKGSGDGQFVLPHSVAVDREGRVYVGDRENRRMQVFDAAGKLLHVWKHVGSPWGIYITEDQTLYMCDGYNNRILKVALDGKVLGSASQFGKLPGDLDFAHHLSVGPGGEIYVAEIKNWRAQKFLVK